MSMPFCCFKSGSLVGNTCVGTTCNRCCEKADFGKLHYKARLIVDRVSGNEDVCVGVMSNHFPRG